MGPDISYELRAVNRSRGVAVCERLENAGTLMARGRGLLGRRELAAGTGMLFRSSALIPFMWMHMFGMRFPIDIVFLDSEDRVIRVNHSLQPWRLSSLVVGARRALELPAGTAARTGLCVGDQIALEELAAKSRASRTAA
jgi:uncharacterized membrane protein (UPF0127 family)